MSYETSKRVLVCNDSALLFEEAFWHHTKHNKDIAIVSDNFRLMRELVPKYADRHYPGEYKYNMSENILYTPHGRIFIESHNAIRAGINIHRGFMLQDIEKKTHIKQLINKIFVRCRIK